jgi:hypothetical protein
VQILLQDCFGATAINGAGGDLAQDARWDSPDGLVIFEIKSFRGRLGSSQRGQVKRSLTRAVKLHAPARWVLITRSHPTPGDLTWLEKVGGALPGVALEWWGRDWLDTRMAGREDLIAYVEGPNYKSCSRLNGSAWNAPFSRLGTT